MLNFKAFLREQAEEAQEPSHLKHLTHVNMHHIDDGEEGFHRAVHLLSAAHDHITSGGHGGARVTTKYDGSPSIVFGRHPTTGRFFVATKSAFNKNPKLNYTPADIEKNHGHAPGLAEKMKQALKHLKKVAPKKGIYQGDLMYGEGDVKDEGKDGASFKPNTITYTARGDEAKKVKKSKIGVVVHTKYHGPTLETMRAAPVDHLHDFGKHPDVNVIDPEIDMSKVKHTPENEKAYQEHMAAAHKVFKSMPHNSLDVVKSHSQHLNRYLNDTVRTGEVPSVEGYKKHLIRTFEKEAGKRKSESGKAAQRELLSQHLKHVDDHKEHFDAALQIHHHLQQAKNALVSSLNGGSRYETKIGNTPTSDEGYVVSHPKYGMTKLVNQAEFSRANFLNDRNK
jgi:Family of unknown function (DUF6267)